MSKTEKPKWPNPKKVTNILTVTSKFYTKNGWPWCRTRVYANGWWCGISDKYAGSGCDAVTILKILEESGHVKVGMDRVDYVTWCRDYNIHAESDSIVVGRLKDL